MVGIHDYDDDLTRIAMRYATEESLPRLFRRERPGGRMLPLEGHPHAGQPIVLSEFGGIALERGDGSHKSWGYTFAATRYVALMRVVRSLPLLAGYVYTQF